MTPAQSKEWIEHAPTKPVIAPNLVAWIIDGDFYCATCIGRLMGRGCCVGNGVALWNYLPVPKQKCACCDKQLAAG